MCGLCEQQHHGVVRCALGWACWKTYAGRPEEDDVWSLAMSALGSALASNNKFDEGLVVYEALLAVEQREPGMNTRIPDVQGALASIYGRLGDTERALEMHRAVFSAKLKHPSKNIKGFVVTIQNLADSLMELGRFAEARDFLKSQISILQQFPSKYPEMKSLMGSDSEYMLILRETYTRTLFERRDPAPTNDDLREAIVILEDLVRRTRRVFGAGHPDYAPREKRLWMVNVYLAANLKIAAGEQEAGIAMMREAFG